MKSIHIILLDDEAEVRRIEEKFTGAQDAENAFADLSADLEERVTWQRLQL